MQYVAPILLAVVFLGALAFFVKRIVENSLRSRPEDPSIPLLQNQLNAGIQQTTQQIDALRASINESVQALSFHISRSLNDANKTVGDRLDNTTKLMGDVRQQLGQLEASSQMMVAIGKDVATLQDILKPPKLRGALGEFLLGDLLQQVLPAAHYRLQHQFKGGETVDAVVLLKAGMVPVDAKFPLENFQRVLAAQTEEERKAPRREFIRDVKKHIDAIATKYIRPDEQTFEFALMYIPAENVYYETIIKEEEFSPSESLFAYALRKHVIPVSPNSFYAYLQTILLGLRGMRIEEKSQDILRNLSRLRKEFDFFSEAFRLVGQHLDNSSKKYMEAQQRLGRVEAKVEQLDAIAQEAVTEAGADRALSDSSHSA